MSLLLETALQHCPRSALRAHGELHAACDHAEFRRIAAELSRHGRLADLFAGVDEAEATLTAVFADAEESVWVVLRCGLAEARFESLTPTVHAASWYEREIKEMYGIEPVGHPAPVPLRLHDWPADVRPMRDAIPTDLSPSVAPAPPRLVQGQGVLQVPLGPVRSGPQEAAGFLFSSGGEDLVRVEPQLGYKFRGVERLAEGRSPDAALVLAERLAGISTFANALAFAQACERAQGLEVPRQARHDRSLLAELERLHHHLGTLARVAEACGQAVAAAQLGVLKEEVLRACAALTGHRYLRGALAIGGLTVPLPDAALGHLRHEVEEWGRHEMEISNLLQGTATFIDRLERTAVLPVDYANLHYLLGPIGRASGCDRDARRDHPYAAYEDLAFDVPTDDRGDASARVRVLHAEIVESTALLARLLHRRPAGPLLAERRDGDRSALGWAEAPGGEALHFVELDERGLVRRWRARPPAVVNWHPYAHACASGNNLTDYPVLEASFGLSHAELDR